MELQSYVVPKVLGLKIKFISNTPIRLLLPLYIYKIDYDSYHSIVNSKYFYGVRLVVSQYL